MRKLVPFVVALLFALPGPALAFNGFATFTEVGDAGAPNDPMHVGPGGVLFDQISQTLTRALAGHDQRPGARTGRPRVARDGRACADDRVQAASVIAPV